MGGGYRLLRCLNHVSSHGSWYRAHRQLNYGSKQRYLCFPTISFLHFMFWCCQWSTQMLRSLQQTRKLTSSAGTNFVYREVELLLSDTRARLSMMQPTESTQLKKSYAKTFLFNSVHHFILLCAAIKKVLIVDWHSQHLCLHATLTRWSRKQLNFSPHFIEIWELTKLLLRNHTI